jgi:hypothetical protein
VAGAGKFGCDRAHAEFNAQAGRQLRKGKDQKNSRQHAEALVAACGVNGTMVIVVVSRNADTDQCLDPGHIHVAGEAPPVAVSQADKDFDPNDISLVEWLTQRGTFHTTLLHCEKTPTGRDFIDKCFEAGKTGAKTKVHTSTARERRQARADPQTGLDMIGPGQPGDDVWDIKDTQARYSALFTQQKGSLLVASDASSISAMAHAKWAVRFQRLQVINVKTIAQLLALSNMSDADMASAVSTCRSVTVAAVCKWAAAVVAMRAAGV